MKRAWKKKGWVTPSLCPRIPRKIMIDDPELLPQPFWDDWNDPRDSMRGYPDNTRLRSKYMWGAEYHQVERWNKKIRRELIIRRKKKIKCQILEPTSLQE